MRLLFCLAFMIVGLCSTLHASEAVSDGDYVLVYDDGLFGDIADAAEKELSEDLKKRNIKWSVKSNKGGTLIDLSASLQKDVLDKEPSHVVLSFGMFDVCDPKKLSVEEVVVRDLISALDASVTQLQTAGIQVILATPGLAGEDFNEPHNLAIDALSDAIRSYAAEKSIKLCDIRKKAVDWIKANPPEKAGRLQLSKKGGKWDNEGENLLAPLLMGSVGLSKSGIKRALKWDERVILATSMSEWQAGIEKTLTPEIRTAGPQQAPKGFFNPGVSGPVYIHASIADFEKSDFEADRVKTQKPTVLFLYPFQKILIHTQYDTNNIPARLEQAMKFMSEAEHPSFAMTPFWYNEDGQKSLGEKGKRYERCKEIAQMTRDAAAKYGIPVVDLFAICEKEHAADNTKIYWGPYEADPKSLTLFDDGKTLLGNEIKRVLGIIEEE